MKIATWNIAGGHKMRSLDAFDYEPKINITYFVDQLRNINADVVCIQESQCNNTDSVARRIANKLRMHVYETTMHPSHIDPGYSISLAVLSRTAFKQTAAFVQPYPSFDLFLPNGKPAGRHDKYLQVVKVDGINIVNVMTQPLEFLGHPYDDKLGSSYALELCDMFSKTLSRPTVFAGDFNTPDPAHTFAAACTALNLQDSVPHGNTKPHGSGHLDCIFYSSPLTVHDSAIVTTETDHFLCWADIDTQFTCLAVMKTPHQVYLTTTGCNHVLCGVGTKPEYQAVDCQAL